MKKSDGNLPPFQWIALNFPRGRTEKIFGFDWQVATNILPTTPIRAQLIRCTDWPQEQWLCAGVISSSLLSVLYFKTVVLSLKIILWLVLKQFHYPRYWQ